MSLEESSKMKLDRGTSLSKEQYDLIYDFLKYGKKPSNEALQQADLYGNLNTGHLHPNTSKFARLKSIAKRLRIRNDQQLVFKSNNKIVIPNSQFEEVIMEAHANVRRGGKHLNITRTLEAVG